MRLDSHGMQVRYVLQTWLDSRETGEISSENSSDFAQVQSSAGHDVPQQCLTLTFRAKGEDKHTILDTTGY